MLLLHREDKMYASEISRYDILMATYIDNADVISEDMVSWLIVSVLRNGNTN